MEESDSATALALCHTGGLPTDNMSPYAVPRVVCCRCLVLALRSIPAGRVARGIASPSNVVGRHGSGFELHLALLLQPRILFEQPRVLVQQRANHRGAEHMVVALLSEEVVIPRPLRA